MMSLTTLLIRGDLWGTASLNPRFGTYLLRVSPRSLLMQTGLIQALSATQIPPRGRGTDRFGVGPLCQVEGRAKPQRVRRPHGGTGYGTERRRGSCSQKRCFLPMYT